MIKNMKIGQKINFLLFFIVIIFIAVIYMAGLRFVDAIHDARNNTAKAAAEIGYEVVNYYLEEHRAGRLLLEDAQKKALEQLKFIRYEGVEYYWVNTGSLPYPTMVMHSVNAALDGQVLSSPTYNVAMGRNQNLFQAMVEVCLKNGEGYVDYMWPRPGDTVPVSKISYVKHIKDWDWVIGTGVYTDIINAEVRSVVIPVTLIIIFTVLLIFLISFLFVSFFITNPVKNAAQMLKEISEGKGDLTCRLEVKNNDEIGLLAQYFNAFADKLQGIIQEIGQGVNTLASSSTQLSAVSDDMQKGVQNVSERAETVAAASEEISTNMEQSAAAMEQSSSNTNLLATAAEEMSSTINEIANNAGKARSVSDDASSKASRMSEHMSNLKEAADSIGKVIETITEISEQVNLLALNATIEAARAGEAGKGFAVVANEIKELARQTAAASQDIREKIEDIQGTTATTIHEVGEITTVINGVSEVVGNIAVAVEEQSTAASEIAGNVAQISQGIELVHEHASQNATVVAEVTKDIAGISHAMGEMKENGTQVNDSARELSKLSESLKQMVGQFKI